MADASPAGPFSGWGVAITGAGSGMGAQAARRFARVIERGCSYTVIPWQMGVVAKLLRLLPNWLYDRLFAKAPRKPKVL